MARARLRKAVERTFEDSVIDRERYRDLVGLADLPDPDDEHVLAAARCVGAQAIVTMNLKDFPADKVEPSGIEVLHPDDFLLDLVDLFPVKVARIVEEQASTLKNPPKTYEEVFDALTRSVPTTVARLREL